MKNLQSLISLQECSGRNVGQSAAKHGNDTATTRQRHGNGLHRFRIVTLLLLLLTLGVGQMWGASITSDGNAILFFKMDAVAWWTAGTSGDGNFAYFYGTSGNAWSAHSVQQTGNYYYIKIPSGTWDHVILTRNNTSTSPTWDNKWNQTGDIELQSGKNYISAFSENSATATFGTYQVTSTASLGASSTSITTAQTSTLTPSLSSNTTYNAIKSTTYSVTTNPGSAGSVTSGGVFSATAAGTYTVTATVTYNAKGYTGITKTATATKSITVTAPPSNTLTVNTDGHGTITTPSGGSTSYTIGSPVSISATNNTGYSFVNWTTTSGTVTFGNASSASTTATVTAGTTATIQANFTENMRTVTITANPSGAGTFTVGGVAATSTTAGISTSRTVAATASTGYAFDSWTATNCNVTSTTSSSTTLRGDGSTGSGTLVANFVPKWAIKGSGTEMGAWETFNALDYVSGTTFRGTITLAANSTYEFKVVDREANAWYGNNSAFVGQSNSLTFSTDEASNCHIATASAGIYTFEFNSSTLALTVSYPDVHPSANFLYVKDNAWTGPAKAYTYNDEIANWNYQPNAGSFEFDGNTYYFAAAGGNANIIISDNGDGIKRKETTTSGNLGKYWDFSSSEFKEFKVLITLDNESATSPGTESVNPVYTSGSTAALSSITVPIKTGYTFGGYYTARNGEGSQLINASGVWQTVATYTNGSKQWIKPASVTLYAKWTVKTTAITLNLNGGTSGATSVTATYDAALPSFTLATKTGGYNLTGYWTESSGGTKVINADGTFAANDGIWNRTDGATLTLYAQWSSFLTVTYDGNGNTGGTAPTDDTEYSSGATVTVKAKPDGLVKTGYTFTGWKTGGTTYTAGQTFSITANTTLAAQWSENLTTVTINVNPSGAGTLTLDAAAFTAGNTANAGVTTSHTVTTTANTGYIFNNWTTTGNATGSASTNTYTLKGNGSAGTGTLTANFTAKTLVRLYFSNPNNWADVNAYIYDFDGVEGSNAGWPGEAASAVVIGCNEYYYYEYYKEDHPEWDVIIFNNGSGGDGNQTADLSFDNTDNNGQYTNGIYDDWFASPTTRWSLFGSWDSWAAGSALTCASATSGYVELDLDANTNYEFKFVDNTASAWYGATTVTRITYANKATAQSMNSTSGSNQTITTAGAGTYRFDWNITSKQVTVTYPTSYTVTYGEGSGGTSVSATVGGNALTSGDYVAAGDDVTFTQTAATGYTFKGWYTTADGNTTVATMGVSDNVLNGISANATVYAQYTANTYTITLDKQTSAAGYGSAGTAANPTATYNTALPAISGTMPAGTGSYGFMGFYTEADGEGLCLIDASGAWIASVSGYTDADTKWIRDGGVTLYAYYKQAEITELTLAETIVGTAETDSITVTPVIAPTPAGTTIICWEVQYSNGNALSPQPAGRLVSGNTYRFKAPTASATYQIEATLRSGASCGGGSVLSTRIATFQVAGEHTVTVEYKCGDMTLAAATEVEARPLEWSDDITAPTITGYTFSGWVAGDGVTIKDDEDATATTHIKAIYDGTLTANYTKKRLIYFNNTLNWENVYVYFYKNNTYWGGSNQGSGANTTWEFTNTPYGEGLHGEMTQIDGTNIYYFDAEAAGVNASYTTVVFTELQQHGCDYFYDNNKVIKRDDYKSTTLPMFVPIADQTPINMNSGTAAYYSEGYWMNYPENTGYTLKIYNKVEDGGDAPYELQSVPFTFTADYTMPMEIEADLEANRTYGFKIYRADNSYYGNNGTMTANTDNWAITTGTNNCGLHTTVAGNYKFSLAYFAEAGDYKYRVGVTYPVAADDYRIVYSDLAAWSGAAHAAAWGHPSRVITRNSGSEAKQDTVSFFWAYGSSPALKYQTCTAVGEGSATWSAGTAVSVSSFSSILTETGVYNFIFEQPAGGASISLVKVEPYDGKYYIRTDCAGATKWANYRTIDHEMTYSDYAETNSGFSHYFAHWVTSGTNVKFTIANDYSPCVSDTLTTDYGTVIADISAGGDLNSGNANIRFMWNQSTNKLSRAYISGSGNIADRFLVLEGDAKMYDEDGNALTTAGGGKISGLGDNEMNLIDDENFVYERTIQVNTQARAKLTAKYNNNVQYFIGAEDETVELLGGETSATKYTMRIVYDFKTNRLVTAYMPSDAAITEDLAIHADIMIVREHQNAGQQLTFDGGSLSDVKTVYGVMRFNRWTLNNKSTAAGHAPVGDPKSTYERSLYWISFPFDVNLSDVFGFGTYGTHWIIEYYDGAERATEGYWKDSEGFWKYITNRRGVKLEAGKGYILALDLDLMRDNNTSFWSNNIEQVELFFPSAAAVENIEETNTEITVDSHECTITARPGMSDDRTKKDSHWNIIGVPSYANYGSELKDGNNTTITWNENPSTQDLPFLYEWNMVDNTYSVQSGTTYPFQSMHAYMVQYYGTIKWLLASATPSSAPARVTNAPQNVEFRLELQQNDKMTDQTFIRMTNDEAISANFDFNYDLSKQMNSGKANIYTMVEGYIQTAGNCLPTSEQTTIVPVGVKIAANDDYTFTIPDGTSGVGVTLIDTETGVRTNLSALDYTVSLEEGTYNERFVMEISPIQQVITDVQASEINDQKSDVRKQLIDGLLYIVRDGKMYDARGARVE